MARDNIEGKAKDTARKKKIIGDPKCKGCRQPRTRSDYTQIGGFRYHPECAEARPKARQEYDLTNKAWIRLG